MGYRTRLVHRRGRGGAPRDTTFKVVYVFLTKYNMGTLSSGMGLLTCFHPNVARPGNTIGCQFFHHEVTTIRTRMAFALGLRYFAHGHVFRQQFDGTLFSRRQFQIGRQRRVVHDAEIQRTRRAIVRASFGQRHVYHTRPIGGAFSFAAVYQVFTWNINIVDARSNNSVTFNVFLRTFYLGSMDVARARFFARRRAFMLLIDFFTRVNTVSPGLATG